jgi:hypothetical protein
MCVDCVLASPRIAQVDLGDEPLPEVVLSQYHIGANRNRRFDTETFFCQRCCDTVFWHIEPCIMLSPIRTFPRVGAQSSLPEVVLLHL